MEGRSDCIMSLSTWQKLTAARTRNMVLSSVVLAGFTVCFVTA